MSEEPLFRYMQADALRDGADAYVAVGGLRNCVAAKRNSGCSACGRGDSWLDSEVKVA